MDVGPRPLPYLGVFEPMRTLPLRLWLLLIPACWTGSVSAQQVVEPERELPVEWITVDDGLPQGMVRAMLQDRHGFIWFGTKDGLVRYDGHRMRVFRQDPTGHGLCGSHITALLESRDGLMWVATEEHGICVFDPRTERFERVEVDARVDRSRTDAPRLLREHTDGNIWVVHIHGSIHVIQRFTGRAAGAAVAPRMSPIEAVYRGAMPKGTTTGLLTMRNGDVWITDYDSLRVLRTEQDRLLVRAVHALPGSRARSYKLGERTMLLPDTARQRVLLIHDEGISVHDERTGAHRSLFPMPTSLRMHGHFLLDGRNRLWMGANHGGSASRLDLTTGVLEEFLFVAQNRSGVLAQPLVVSWLEDREGNIWAGTGGFGAVKYAACTERFQRLRMGRYATLIQPDLAGRYIVVGEGHEWLNAPGGRPQVLAARRAMEAAGRQAIWGSVVVAPDGVQWTSTEKPLGVDPVLCRFDPLTDGGLEPVPLAEGEHPCEVLPGLGHDLWMTAYGEHVDRIDRLIRMDTRTGLVLRRYPMPVPIQVAEYRAISDWRIRPDGTLLLGTLEGVMILDPEHGSWRTFTHRPEEPRSLPDATVFSICPDPALPDAFLWVGTAGAGLARLDLNTGRCVRYTTAQGLPNDVIYGILSDARGNLWLSTNNGLCRFDPRSGATRHYTRDHGLCGNEFNRYSAHRGADGRFYFAGVDGVTAFDPEELYAAERPSPTRITSLRLAGRELFAVGDLQDDAGRGPLDSSITHSRVVELSYDEPVISFDFACMDATAPARNAYRYRLKGFIDEWLHAHDAQEATFTNLDPGSYRFEVQGRNSAGIWDPIGATLTLIITPPWWGTWWFRASAALVVLALLYGLYRYRLAQQLRLALVRERIARDLHDEIGSTLSSVAFFSEAARRQGAGEGGVKGEMLERISQSTSQMVESMNDIVWAVNSRNDDLLHVVQRMNEFAARMAEAGGFTLDLLQEGFDPDQVLSMTQRKNLYLIFKEAVNNAAKYARCRTLTVRITIERNVLVMRVQDDGIGLDPSANGGGNGAARGGNGLRNMRSRAEEIKGTLNVTSGPGQGTCIDLRFPL